MKEQIFFGFKSLWGGGVAEFNSRVDVVMLGIFLSDRLVGVYSFAAMFAEGMMQLSAIFRVNYNPLITRLVAEKKFEDMVFMVKKFFHDWIFPLIFISIPAVAGFWFVANIFLTQEDAFLGWTVFAMLMLGVVIKSGYDVFWEIPMQSGYPGYQSLLISAVAFSNIVFNYILISKFGLYGAAIELTISSILGIILFKLIVRKTLSIKI